MILFLSTADTEILALRSAIEGLPEDFPSVRAANPTSLEGCPNLDGMTCVIIRLLGGRSAWEAPFDELKRQCAARNIPLLAFGGEAAPDAELTAASTEPATTIAQAFEYLVHGGAANTEHLLRFVIDTVFFAGFGFNLPEPVPPEGIYGPGFDALDPGKPTIAVIFYRAHLLAGNTGFIDELCEAIRRRGANALACYCYSLRPDADGDIPVLSNFVAGRADVIITTVLATGTGRTADGTVADAWTVPIFEQIDVPIIQAIAATSDRETWERSDNGLRPLDVAWSVALPEFDGRIITVPLSFKEVVDDGDNLGTEVIAYRTVADRVERIAGISIRLAMLRHTPNANKRIAVVLSAYPTKRGRVGNAVGLDTPVSVIRLLHALRDAGYHVDRIPEDGDTLMAELIETFSYEHESLTRDQLTRAVGRVDVREYTRWFSALPPGVQAAIVDRWGPPPGDIYRDGDALCMAGMEFGNVLLTVQPPRGFGEDPIAIYHAPDLPPTHHYLAFYRWLEHGFGADAIVHVGKHGNLEWLPGKSLGLSADCATDAVLGDLPLVYPFVVNDPGEGTQAKRRAHAVIVDHLVPPMTRAEVYDDLARLERLLDEYYQVSTLDPSKLPAIRSQIWELIERAELHRDLERDEAPGADAFDDFLVHLDGYLCELKDAQIRGGLHVLGEVPTGESEVDLLAALLRLPQGSIPSLRESVAGAMGLDLRALLAEPGRRIAPLADHPSVVTASDAIDIIDAESKHLLREAQQSGWDSDGTGDGIGAGEAGWAAEGNETTPTRRVLQFAATTLVPNLQRTTDEIANTLHALDGGYIPAGPSGAPTRGMAHVLPTGRNFYSVDPKTLPTSIAWEVGRSLADALIQRHLEDEGRYPTSVGLVVWGTAAMRTHGDDIAEVLALLGVRPVWAEESGRVTGLEVISIEELGRPRVDVTLRISGFFRDAFPHLVHLVDEAIGMVLALNNESEQQNPLLANGNEHRIFGAKPGAYGSGILPLLDSRSWRDDADLAAVYLAWSGWGYSRTAYGEPAEAAMRKRLTQIEIAVKNQDNREHDIFDSDDYLQEHGGMVAAIRAISGRQPKAYFGDSADPARPKVRPLQDEARRVMRTRVLNPKWIEAMMRHGYKGAFEMAATVDYLYGYDATARIGEDWMYEQVTQRYVADPNVRKFFQASNPWALRGITERLLEAVERGLWNASDDALATLRQTMLETEGWEEDR